MKILARRLALHAQLCALVCAALLVPGCAPPDGEDPSAPEQATGPLEAVPFTAVRIHDRFWSPRIEANRRVTVPHLMAQNEETERVANFRRAAGLEEGPFVGPRYNDSDVYKTIEAASYTLAQHRDPALEIALDELIELIAASQQPDGYLFPARTVDPENPPMGVGEERWLYVHSNSHELYGAGHLIEAAVAYYRATGKRQLLDVAIRLADLIDETFGPDARLDVPGHEEIELALVKLYQVTDETRYLDLARFFLDQRGHPHDGPDEPEDSPLKRYDVPIYRQDHLPVTEQREAVGHSVRAMYLYTGMADVAALMPDTDYETALEALWQDVVGSKLYLTGGIGAQGTFESFGEAHQLPNATAYAETCAAVGLEFWNQRMFLRSGDVRYADVMERILYNGSLSGVSLEGDSFFYTNPLESHGETQRRSYFGTACCPANISRLLGTLPGYLYAKRGDTLWVNLFVASEATFELDGQPFGIVQKTDYPWSGTVRIEIDPGNPRELELRIRVPGWARNEVLPTALYEFADGAPPPPAVRWADGGDPLPVEGGYAVLRRVMRGGDAIEIDLPMPARRVRADDRVIENRGRRALQRGPLVYAVEAADNAGSVLDLELAGGARTDDTQIETGPLEATWREDLLGGVMALTTSGTRSGEPVEIIAVPYFAWANRGPGEMAVWIPVEGHELLEASAQEESAGSAN